MYARIAFPAAVQWGGNIAPTGVHTLMMVCGESKRSRQMTPPGVGTAKLTDSRDLRDISNSRRCASLRSDRDSTALFPNWCSFKPRRYRSLSAFLSISSNLSIRSEEHTSELQS